MGIFTTVAVWVCGAMFFTYFIVCEFLDAIGRLELVEAHWPRVYGAMSNRPMRLGLLIFLLALIGKDVAERWQEGTPPCLTITTAAPPAPIIQLVSPPPSGGETKGPRPPVGIREEGNGNSANPGTTTAPVHVEPCGVFQNGGSNNSASPTCAPPERHVTKKQKTAISEALKGKQIIVHVGYLVNVPDAEDYANELCDAIQEGIPTTNCNSVWGMMQEGRGAPWAGVEFVYKGDPVPVGTRVSLPPDNPATILMKALLAAGLNKGTGHSDPKAKDNEVTLIVGPPPKD